LIYSFTGYYGIFDFGIRSSLVRYVSKFQATGDKDELARLVNTNLFIYSCIGLILLLPTVVGSFYVDRLFKISPGFLRDARILFLIVGLSLALGFPIGIADGISRGLAALLLNQLDQYCGDVDPRCFDYLRSAPRFRSSERRHNTVSLPLVTSAIRA